MVVVDASVVLGVLFPDEPGDPVGVMAELMTSGVAVCPSVWPLEVLNAIVVGVRRQRWSFEDAGRLIEQVGRMRIKIEPVTPPDRYGGVASLAREHRLSVYDASYLQLAIERKLPLATRAPDLAQAAQAEGVPLYEMSDA
jgi:predicted nucleic acid-binding protein